MSGIYVAVRSPEPWFFSYPGVDLTEEHKRHIADSVGVALTELGFLRVFAPPGGSVSEGTPTGETET